MLRAGCIWTALINAFFLDFLAVITNILQTSELIYEISKKNYQQHGPKGVRIRSGDAKIESGTFPASDYVTDRSYTDQWHRVIGCLHFTGRTNHHGRTCATCLRSVTGREDHIFENSAEGTTLHVRCHHMCNEGVQLYTLAKSICVG